MNLVPPGITVNLWDTVEVSPSLIPVVSCIDVMEELKRVLASFAHVQPLSGECGMLFKMSYKPKMLAESEIPYVD